MLTSIIIGCIILVAVFVILVALQQRKPTIEPATNLRVKFISHIK